VANPRYRKVQSRTRGRAKALTGAGCVLWQQGEYAQAQPLFEESIAIWQELGDRSGLRRPAPPRASDLRPTANCSGGRVVPGIAGALPTVGR